MLASHVATLSSLEEQYESFRDCSYDVSRFVDIVSVKVLNAGYAKCNEACQHEWETIRKQWRSLRRNLKETTIETNITIKNYWRALHELDDEESSKDEKLEMLHVIFAAVRTPEASGMSTAILLSDIQSFTINIKHFMHNDNQSPSRSLRRPIPRKQNSLQSGFGQLFDGFSSFCSGWLSGAAQPPRTELPLSRQGQASNKIEPVHQIIQWVTSGISGEGPNQTVSTAHRAHHSPPRTRRSKTTELLKVQTSPLHLPDDEYVKTLKHIVVLMGILEQHVGVFEKVECCVRDAFTVLRTVVKRDIDSDEIDQLLEEYAAFDRFSQKLIDNISSV
ncbi:hypothetical protein SISSUDRAFT_1048712, partial [Sistotremastrum suecicum HHB10207 ss-3]